MLFFNSARRGGKSCFSVCAVSFVILFLLFVLSLCAGSVNLSFSETLAILKGETDSAAFKIIRYVRLPRAVAAILCGAALACSGALIQTVLQNPLGSPNVVGMNSGAGLCVILCAAFVSSGIEIALLPIAAFSGSFLTLILVCALGKKIGGTKTSVILAGIAATCFFTAISDAVTVFVPDTIYSRAAFRIGSLAGVQLNSLAPASLIIVFSVAASLILGNDFDILSLGDETSSSLGLSVSSVRIAALVIASLLSGAAVSFAGLVGFAGLVVPHCARVFVGSRTRFLIPTSVLFGACLLLLCDFLSRIVFAPYEIPVGIILSLVGAPFFVRLLFSKRGKEK